MGGVTRRLGFIGAGQRGGGRGGGGGGGGVCAAGSLGASDPNPARLEVFRGLGAEAFASGPDLVRGSGIVVLAVKPQYVVPVLEEVRSALTPDHLVVSIAAGVALKTMEAAAGDQARIVRVMPNTPCLVGEAASALCMGALATPEDGELVQQLMGAVGTCYQVEERLISAVTGLSGSGPAYVFMMIEALADGGVAAGLPRGVAQALAAQTVLGSAKMVLETGVHPGQLKDNVASPAGTTIAGIRALEDAGVRAAFINAVKAASDRADELSKPSKL